jgi:pimeloyl-ACP methyl ester carboxylesterase
MHAINEGEFFDINGIPQWVAIRGASRANPALLVIGGPGASFAALAPFFAAWERDLTLVHWDPPGAGFTFACSGAEPKSVAALAADGARVGELACARLGKAKLAVLGVSAGTIVGLHMAQSRPDLFSAYVGSGQIVDWPRQDALSYALLLERARAAGNVAMLKELTALGPPPYRDSATDAVKSKYAGAPTRTEAAAFAELMPLIDAALRGEPAEAPYLAPGLRWPEPFARSLAAYTALRAEIVSFDARRLGSTFSLPLCFIQGMDDVFTVTAEVERYAAELSASHVELVRVPGAGHSPFLLRDEMLALLARHVRPWLA